MARYKGLQKVVNNNEQQQRRDDDDEDDDNDDDDYDKCIYSNQETAAYEYHVIASKWHRHSICTRNGMIECCDY